MTKEKNLRTLHLVLKRKWWDMIESGEKKEEYREIKPYWEKRLLNYKGLVEYYLANRAELEIKSVLFPHRPLIEDVCKAFPRGYTHVTFQLGYQKNAPRMTFEIEEISIGKGREDWGAPTDEEVFIIKLGKRI